LAEHDGAASPPPVTKGGKIQPPAIRRSVSEHTVVPTYLLLALHKGSIKTRARILSKTPFAETVDDRFYDANIDTI
jgi:hypothetical protein